MISPFKASTARRRLGAALFLGVALAAQALAALDQKEVKVQGFMLPLDVDEKRAFFILSAVPPTCAFCMPGGPEAVIEVRAKRPLAYTDNAVTVSGRLSVLKDDPTGIFYRLTDAMPVK